MNVKRYFSALVIILTLFGLGQQQVSIPNQEIVVQFTDDEVTSNDTHNAIEIVKNQLQSIGANNIHVIQEENGKLKITYYSDIDIAGIKDLLSQEESLKLGYASNNDESSRLPSNDGSNSYNFDVFEIQKPSNSEWDFEGTLVLELKPDGDRFFHPKVFASIDEVDVEIDITSVAYKLNSNIAIAIDNTSYKIPEVRAGPLA